MATQQVKIFEFEKGVLEQHVNDWLVQNQQLTVRDIKISPSQFGQSVVLIWFDVPREPSPSVQPLKS